MTYKAQPPGAEFSLRVEVLMVFSVEWWVGG